MPGDSGPLEAIGLGRRRTDGEGWLLREVALRIGPGERVALVGPTGAGKTLLLRALALLDPIDAGEVLWCGRAIRGASVPPFRRRVIYLHQRPALFEGTVEENLRLPYTLKGRNPGSFDRPRVVDFLAELGRDGSFLARSHRDLSGGEAQLTALVRALQLDPAMLLLDEPTAALDALAARAAERMLERWREEQPASRSLVWVSHDPEQARRVSDRRLKMDAGRLGEEG